MSDISFIIPSLFLTDLDQKNFLLHSNKSILHTMFLSISSSACKV
nr:MAG TPA: hypothetical protein [Caudoviricetes sp.]DAR22068.1 MAG TPA: hypothetical protein [Caudoviricetes sp.]